MAAVHVELNKRYNEMLSDLLITTHDILAQTPVPTWQEWIRIASDECRAYYNAHRPICEILLGPLLHRQCILGASQGNDMVGRSMLRNMRRLFHVPEIPGLEQKFANSCDIVEVFWARSYVAHGRVDQASFDESIRASVSYLRSVLPETLPLISPAKTLPIRKKTRHLRVA